MSKNFGKSRRVPVLDKGSDEKRPSVFERLGVRSRDIPSSSVGPGPPSETQGPPRWSSDMKPAAYAQNRDSRPRIPQDIGKRSGSPSYSSPVNKQSRKKLDPASGSPLSPPFGKASRMNDGTVNPGGRPNGKRVAKDSPNKVKIPKSDQKHLKKEKVKKRIVKKVDKKKKKLKASSGSSGSSDSDSSSSSSHSSSSSSSTSSNNSSSSDSSVPSIKLKSEKLKPKKRKQKLKNDKKLAVSKQLSSKSSSSGMDTPASVPSHLKRGNIDLREKLNARSPRSPLSMNRDQYLHKDPRGAPMGMSEMPKRMKHHDRGPMPIAEDHDNDKFYPKKRPLSHDYQPEEVKRKRMISPAHSPPDKYRQPHESSPHLHRRAPPQMQENLNFMPKRGRTPPGFQKDSHPPLQHAHPQHRVSHSPMRRTRPEDMRRNERGDYRNESDKRNSPFPHGNKPRDPREFDRRREPDYIRDNRQGPGPGGPPMSRERFAPSRPPMDHRQDRDRNLPPDYQRRPPLPPQQQRPPPQYNQNPHDMNRGSSYRGQAQQYDKDRPRYSPHPSSMEDKRHGNVGHMSMLPKSKEALSERYELDRKSGYVDKWVDETVRAVQRNVDPRSDSSRPPLLPLPTTKPSVLANAPSISSITRDEYKEVQGPGSESNKSLNKPIVEADDLSDFSDDADEILNTAESPQASVPETTKSSEIEDKKESIADKSSLSRSTETPMPSKRSASIDTAPSVMSQEKAPSKSKVIESGKSLPSQSQTDDDILEQMDFEEISEDELGDVENKVHIVDALGVDWASLVCQEKKPVQSSHSGEQISTSARKRWSAANVLSQLGISKKLAGEKLYNRIMEESTVIDQTSPSQAEKGLNIIDKIGLGPNSRALSSRRDMAMRRHFLGLSQKSLLSLDFVHQSSSSTPPEMDSVGDLYKLSIALFNSSKKKQVQEPTATTTATITS